MNHLTRKERDWILYDVGNSAFVMLTATVIPIYFKNMAGEAGMSLSNSTAYFGYASTIVTVIAAILGPILGAVADLKGRKMPIFLCFMGMGALGCISLSIPASWLSFLAVYILAKVGFQGSLTFYDSMLTDITEPDRVDQVSACGYAWGYLGSCVPFVLSILLVLGWGRVGLTDMQAVKVVFWLNAVWWFLMTLPLVRSFEQTCYVEAKEHPIRESFGRLVDVIKEVKKNKKIFWFLAAFFFYIDGVYTIIDMATSYGKDVGISDGHLMLALLLTQVVGFPCSIIFGMLAKKIESGKLIRYAIVGYLCVVVFAVQMSHAWEFWLLAVCVAVFQGGIQALSRSYFTRIIPKEQAAEYFGFFDIFGKGAVFVGTLLVGAATQISGSSRVGIGLLAGLFAVGYVCFRKMERV